MTTRDDKEREKKQPDGAAKVRQTTIPVDEEDVAHQQPLRWTLVLRLMRFLKPYKLRMVGNVVLVMLSSFAMLLGVEAVRRIVRYMRLGPEYVREVFVWSGLVVQPLAVSWPSEYFRDSANAPTKMFVWIGVLTVNAFLIWQLGFVRQMGLVKVGQRVLMDLRVTIFGHLQELSLSYYDRTKQGWILSRATSDLGVLEDIISGTVPELAWVVFLIVGGTVRVLIVSPMLFLVVLGALPLMVLITFFFHGHIAGAWRNIRAQVSRICANLAENIAGVRVVQAFTRERHNLREFDRLNREYYDARVRATVVRSLYFPSIGVLSSVATAAVILIVGWKAEAALAAGVYSVNVEDMVLVLLMLRMFFEPIRHLSMMYGNALGAMASAERIFGLLDTEPDVRDRPGARELPAITGDVRFEGVTFAYNPGEPVLTDVNLEARRGETVALVGPTGAGKSSIINLLCRFYEQQEGQITVDGYDLRDVTMHSLRSQMGIVMQEPFLFSGTVMQNLKFGRPEATDEEVYEAARAVGAHDILSGLRDGYQTEVQERGEALSGGERQLVCFTRAMVADPGVLVLDEATSSVDTATELKIQEALDRLVRRRTSFVVAHRLSTVRNADQVLVIQNGRIIERGTHESLLARHGEYARMYREFLREG